MVGINLIRHFYLSWNFRRERRMNGIVSQEQKILNDFRAGDRYWSSWSLKRGSCEIAECGIGSFPQDWRPLELVAPFQALGRRRQVPCTPFWAVAFQYYLVNHQMTGSPLISWGWDISWLLKTPVPHDLIDICSFLCEILPFPFPCWQRICDDSVLLKELILWWW